MYTSDANIDELSLSYCKVVQLMRVLPDDAYVSIVCDQQSKSWTLNVHTRNLQLLDVYKSVFSDLINPNNWEETYVEAHCWWEHRAYFDSIYVNMFAVKESATCRIVTETIEEEIDIPVKFRKETRTRKIQTKVCI